MKEKEVGGLYFNEDTPQEVCNAILDMRQKRHRIRVWYGKDGKSWNEENDITGYIGKSTGWKPIPILIHNTRSMGGGALLCDCIVKMVDTTAKRVVYQHPNFSQPVFTVGKTERTDYPYAIYADGQVYSRHETEKQAQRLADFMNGKRNNK